MSLWLAKDQESNAVAALQNALNIRLKPHTPLAVDGIFGDHTEGALRQYQKCQGLKADAIAGPKTLGTLFGRRTLTNTFLVSPAPAPKPLTMPARQGVAATMVASPYDLRHFKPSRPQPQPSRFEDAWRAYVNQPTPKPLRVPAPPPMMDVPAAPPRQLWLRKPSLSLTGSRPSLSEMFGANEWLEFEVAGEVGGHSLEELEVALTHTVAFVKGGEVVKPSASFAIKPGAVALQANLQWADAPILEHHWKLMANPKWTTGVRLAPALITSLMWEPGGELSFSSFLGMRLEATLTREMHNRHGRALSMSLFCGLTGGWIMTAGREARGAFRVHPASAQGLLQIGVRFGLGNRHRHRRQ